MTWPNRKSVARCGGEEKAREVFDIKTVRGRTERARAGKFPTPREIPGDEEAAVKDNGLRSFGHRSILPRAQPSDVRHNNNPSQPMNIFHRVNIEC